MDDTDDRICTFCGREGHRAHACPMRRAMRGDERCTACMVGQGDRCHCQPPMQAGDAAKVVAIVLAPWLIGTGIVWAWRAWPWF